MALAVIGGAALVGAWLSGSGAWIAGLGAFAVGVAIVAGAASAQRLRDRRQQRRTDDPGARAVETLFGADPVPTALTDARGMLLAANPALRQTLRPQEDDDERLPARLESVLSPAAPDVTVAAEVYRLLRGARVAGRARSRGLALGGDARGVVLERLSPDRLLWRMPPDAPEAGVSAAAFLDGLGVAAVAWEGGALRPNRAARTLRPDIGRLLEEAGDAPPEALATADGLSLMAVRAPHAAQTWLLIADPRPGEGAGGAAAAAEMLERLPVAIARLSLDGTLILANEPARRLLGPDAAPGAALDGLVEGLGRSIPDRIAEAARGRASGRSEIARGRREDRETFLQLSLTLVEFEGAPALVAVMSDATELKTLEAQFVQSQKMQAVGQLAGGVAHDFNNLLTAISGHTDLLLMRRDASDADHADLMQIRQNANRAAALVRQMLAFSRKQTLRPTVINLTETLTELSHLLNRLLGEKVRLRLEHAGDLGLVRVDERQFEQVIVNLVVNARDAMAGGGDVRIRTRNAAFEQEYRRDRAVVPPGDYVAVEVSDSGQGIPPDRIGQIFDPFFTTKKPGEGTGLGLSTAYGIIKQTGGFIFADSPPGEGAVFTIYLPRHDESVEPVPAGTEAPEAESGAEDQARGVVLLVEDEAPVRSFASRALALRGYEVIEAESAEEALEILEDETLHVDVIISDVVMPGMDGPSWVKTARVTRPGVAVVFVSGYAEGAFRKSLKGLEDFEFLPKPYSLRDLSRAIADAQARKRGRDLTA
ncbi:MAG: ATP-binding protein [Pseudomonadota bacterium]